MYTCEYCNSKEVTHCLIKGTLVHGYKELPTCVKCAEVIDELYPHYWDREDIVKLIDLTNPSDRNFWLRELLGICKKPNEPFNIQYTSIQRR